MAAPTNAANVKKALANREPSTHGTKQTSLRQRVFEPQLSRKLLFSTDEKRASHPAAGRVPSYGVSSSSAFCFLRSCISPAGSILSAARIAAASARHTKSPAPWNVVRSLRTTLNA